MNRDERDLRDKLRRIEALFAGATTDGERMAAAAAMQRIRSRLHEAEKVERASEFKFTLADEWSRKLFVALCRRYGLSPFRYKRQRLTTVMIWAPKSFVDGTLWPEFQALSQELQAYLQAATDRIIREEVNQDVDVGER
jgi:hypothetical protein